MDNFDLRIARQWWGTWDWRSARQWWGTWDWRYGRQWRGARDRREPRQRGGAWPWRAVAVCFSLLAARLAAAHPAAFTINDVMQVPFFL